MLTNKQDECCDNECHSFVFKVQAYNYADVCNAMKTGSLLIDCGTTVHIFNDKSKFVKFDDKFYSNNHFIELADGSRTNGIVKVKTKGTPLWGTHRLAVLKQYRLRL